ncbi:hypothetical protein CPB97_002033 [Podila verticillata]|nr:hypothetical protein CPB97_002033 [Podila verticillata]
MASSSATKNTLSSMPPEILAAIGRHLPHTDLAAYTRVSKTWYAALFPVLWSAIDDRWLYGQDHGTTGRLCSTDLVQSRKALLLKYGKRIRHMTIYHDSTVFTHASSPKVCELRSLAINNKATCTPLELRQIQAISSLNLRENSEALSLSDPKGPGAQDRCGIAKAVLLLALQHASTLNILSFGEHTDVLRYFTSTRAFYTMLANLPNLRELRVPGLRMSIVALNQALPQLQVLHLARRTNTVAGLNQRGLTRWLRDLSRESEEWCCLTAPEDKGKASAVVAKPSIKKLIFEEFITFSFFRQIMTHSPSIREVCLPVFKTLDFEADHASWVTLRQLERLQVEWAVSPESTKKVVTNACCGHDLDTPFVTHFLKCKTHELSLLQEMSPILRIRRG